MPDGRRKEIWSDLCSRIQPFGGTNSKNSKLSAKADTVVIATNNTTREIKTVKRRTLYFCTTIPVVPSDGIPYGPSIEIVRTASIWFALRNSAKPK